ncbi:beta-lactamase family protein [Sphingomonas sabuli]|uniref:Beta-lactamase family protein n=1 Tax=Sphingomonas sabuli TaxID=2764186 RepID=A0A7G9L5F6_9SPHN|nr:serine hydrolase domain-containing protein [Sphingomonas sabuli]QNM83855.1 beta-lactamase family protein [Sphingomonas sabuli]
MRGALIGLAVALAAPAAALADPVDDVILEQMEVSHLPGVAVAIVDSGKVTKLAGYGVANLEWGAKVDPDTRFQLASATKLFTGILLMKQVEAGRLSLDDPIARFFDGAPASWSGITVRQLANHTSGLGEDLGQPEPKTVAEAAAAAMKQPLAYAPGTEARYGFTDFTILRAVIEKAGGATLPELLARDITRPLQLNATGFAMASDDGPVRTADVLERRASTYTWTGDRQRTADFFFAPLGYGAGGLYSSARDLAALFAAIDSGKLLSRSSLAAIVTPATLPDGRPSQFGIGWTVRDYFGTTIVGHSGGPALADIIRIPSTGKTIVVLTNQQMFFPLLAERVADLSLPAPVLASPVPDDWPRIAANLKALFDAAAAGADDSAFVSPGKTPGKPLRSGFNQAAVVGVGPLSKVQLVKVDPAGKRTYRLTFRRKTWDWLVEADAEGRIATLRPA